MIVHEDKTLAKIVDKEISREVEQMLSCLKPKDRDLFYKLYVEEKTMRQVSLETGMEQ